MTRPTEAAGMLGVLPLGLLFAAFYLFPLLLLLLVSLDPSDSIGAFEATNYIALFTDAFSLGVLVDTLWLALQSTLLAAFLALPLAMYYRSVSGAMQSLLIIIILLPLLTSTVVRTFAWLVILGREGLINSALLTLGLLEGPLGLLYTRPGLIVALAQLSLPLMVLPVINSMLRIDDRLIDASNGLGASRWRTFFLVILPLAAPGILAGALLTYAWTATAFVTHTLVGGGRQIFMPLLIYQQAIGLQKWSYAATLSVVFMAAVIAMMIFIDRVARSRMRGVNE